MALHNKMSSYAKLDGILEMHANKAESQDPKSTIKKTR